MIWLPFRRKLARFLVHLADWFCAPGTGREFPTIAELSHLSFDEVWLRLIAVARPWKVSRLDLVAYRRGQRSTEYSWCEPEVARIEHCYWSLGVAFPRNDGQRCELRATVHGSVTPAHVSLMALTQALQVFAVRFAIHPEARVNVRMVRAADDIIEADDICTVKAA